MTPQELMEAGCTHVRWNDGEPGAWDEYFKAVDYDPKGVAWMKLSAYFVADGIYVVYLCLPNIKTAIPSVKTVEHFNELHALLARSFSGKA